MSDIGPDGLTDEERHWSTREIVQYGDASIAATTFARLAAERLAHAETRIKLAATRETIAAYPAPTTNLRQWAKPTIALIDRGALQAISPVEIEDADGSVPWPGQCIGALVNGFLDLASDVGRHNRDADELVQNAISEVREVAAALRESWDDITESKDILSSAGLAMDVHSSSTMRAHVTSVARQTAELVARAEKAEAERDRLRAALAELADSARSLVGACEEDRLCPVCGSNSNIEDCAASCYVPRTHKRIQAARALLGEVKP